jgi:ferric-dicitrate binding protein FerR (iron transport regulator)
MEDKQKNIFEERVGFVAKHYQEGGFNAGKAWKSLATSRGIRRTIPFRRYMPAAASIFLLLVGITSLYFWNKNRPEWILVSTVHEQLKDVYLPDSTLVHLAGNTELKYDIKIYGKGRRDVKMKGKALFDVRRDESRPFSVCTGPAEVEVLGTTFQVNECSSSVTVQVVEGKVRFASSEKNDKEEVILTAGMSAQYVVEMKEMNVQVEENTNFLFWKTGLLSFRNTPLEEVIDDLTNHYNVKIKSRTTIRGERLTATFNSLPLEQVLLIINQTLDVRLVAE